MEAQQELVPAHLLEAASSLDRRDRASRLSAADHPGAHMADAADIDDAVALAARAVAAAAAAGSCRAT
jgi:hypothetical protein